MKKKKQITALAKVQKPSDIDTTNSILYSVSLTSYFFDILELYSNPEKFLMKHGGRTALRKLIYDDEISSAIDTRTDACLSMPWNLEGKNEEVNEKVKSFLQKNLKPFKQSLVWATYWGYAVCQVVWQKMDDGTIGVKEIIDEEFEKFKIDKLGNLHPAPFTNPIPEEDMIPGKFFFSVRKPSSYSPEGEALLARLFYIYYYRSSGWEFYIQFLESWGKPFIHAVHKDDDAETKALLRKLMSAKRPRGVATGENVEINIKESTRTGDVFDVFQKACTERVQRVVLGQTLTTTVAESGSRAQAEVHNEVRMEKVKVDCDLVEIPVQELINVYCFLNGIIEKDIPIFKHQFPKNINTELAERDGKLYNIGVRFTPKYFQEKYNLAKDDFEVNKTPDFGNLFSKKKTEKFFMDQIQKDHKCFVTPKQQSQISAQESLEDEALDRAETAFSKDQIEAIIRSSKDEKDLRRKLAILMDQDSGEYEDVLTQLLYQSKLKGFVDSKS